MIDHWVFGAAVDADSALLVDGTCGEGGHTEAALEARPNVRILCIDRDEKALHRSKQRLAKYGERVLFWHGSYADIGAALAAHGTQRAGRIVA